MNNNITIKNINIICCYSSEYAGNFIPSLLCLKKKLEPEWNVYFSFPYEAKERYWIKYMINEGSSIYYISSFEGKSFKKEVNSFNKVHNITCVYTHFLSGLKIKSALFLKRNINVIIHVHSDFSCNKSIKFRRRIRYFIERFICKKRTKYIYVSKYLYGKIGNKNNSYYVPNALAIDRVPSNDHQLDLAKEYGIDKNKTIFLLFGWSPFVKGVDVAVQAFLKLDDHDKERSLLVIVHGKNDGLNKCLDYISKTVDESLLSRHNILFIRPVEDIFSLYRLCDVFISSSRSEGFSYSLMEALYHNMEALISDIDGTRWAWDYNNVKHFKSEDSDGLSKLMKYKIGFKKINKTNNKILDDFNIDIWANKIKDIINYE